LLVTLLEASFVGSVHAQGNEVTVSAILIPEEGAGLTEQTIVSVGVRRAVGDIEGLKYVHPVDVLTSREAPAEVFDAVAELDAIAEMVRNGRGPEAAERANAVIEIFENNLESVRRSNLVDAYMLKALAACISRNQRRECRDGFVRVLTFREGLEYDAERYPADQEAAFSEVANDILENGLRGSIEISSEPSGAEVYIDGRSYGASPVVAEGLLVGDHYVTVKAVGYEKLIERVTIEESFQATAAVELETSSQALLLQNDLPHIAEELGQPRTGRAIQGLNSYLYLSQAIVGVVRSAPGDQVEVSLYLYDLRTRFLLSEERGTLSLDEAGVVRAREMVQSLYEGVDLSGAVEAPDTGPEVEDSPEIWEQWWFWTAVGVVAVSGGIVIGVAATSSGPSLPAGWTQVNGTTP
jgi:hypothetical protein